MKDVKANISKSFIFVLAAIAVVVLVVGVPNFIRARNTPSSAPCINRLRQIDGAKQEWALENGKTSNDVPRWADLYPYLSNDFTNTWFTNGLPVCPEGLYIGQSRSTSNVFNWRTKTFISKMMLMSRWSYYGSGLWPVLSNPEERSVLI